MNKTYIVRIGYHFSCDDEFQREVEAKDQKSADRIARGILDEELEGEGYSHLEIDKESHIEESR